jgi:hypothetical protein
MIYSLIYGAVGELWGYSAFCVLPEWKLQRDAIDVRQSMREIKGWFRYGTVSYKKRPN